MEKPHLYAWELCLGYTCRATHILYVVLYTRIHTHSPLVEVADAHDGRGVHGAQHSGDGRKGQRAQVLRRRATGWRGESPAIGTGRILARFSRIGTELLLASCSFTSTSKVESDRYLDRVPLIYNEPLCFPDPPSSLPRKRSPIVLSPPPKNASASHAHHRPTLRRHNGNSTVALTRQRMLVRAASTAGAPKALSTSENTSPARR